MARGKDRIVQGVEHRGSLICVPLALRVGPFGYTNRTVATPDLDVAALENDLRMGTSKRPAWQEGCQEPSNWRLNWNADGFHICRHQYEHVACQEQVEPLIPEPQSRLPTMQHPPIIKGVKAHPPYK